MPRRLQSWWFWLLQLNAAWLVLLPVADAFWGPPGNKLGELAIYRTALFASVYWFLAAILVARCWRPGRGLTRPWGGVIRWVYVAACAVYLLHVAVALHLAHDWSHAAAFDHVQEQSGFGPGIFVSYLFTLVWVLDVMWLAVSLDGYQARPRWVNRVIHGFMAFVVFNATVVYGGEKGRVLFGGATLIVLLVYGDRLGYGRRLWRSRLW